VNISRDIYLDKNKEHSTSPRDYRRAEP